MKGCCNGYHYCDLPGVPQWKQQAPGNRAGYSHLVRIQRSMHAGLMGWTAKQIAQAVKELHFNNEYLRGDTVAVVLKELHRVHAVIMVEVVNRSLTPLSSESN